MSLQRAKSGVLGSGLLATAFTGAAWGQTLDEIIVTASRREESLQDVPISVTALTEQTIQERGLDNFEDYVRSIPGVNYGDYGSQANEIKVRGVGMGTTRLAQTTAIYLGEVPLVHVGQGLNSGFNFRLVDIGRVEVLRGPQGQLYGANSLGGAIKNEPQKPQLDRFGVSTQVSGYGMSEGSDGYDGYITFNVSGSEKFGARITGYYAEEPGWYDNVFAGYPAIAGDASPGTTLSDYALPNPPGFPGICALPPGARIGLGGLVCANPDIAAYTQGSIKREDTNYTETSGARVMLTWAPNDRFSGDLMLAHQQMERFGTSWATSVPNVPGVRPGTISGGFNANGTPATDRLYATDPRSYEYADTFDAANSDEASIVNVALNWDFEFASLLSSTSYWDRKEILETNIPLDSTVTGVATTFPVLVVRTDEPTSTMQEFRLTSNNDGRLSWLGGFFWQEIEQNYVVPTYDGSGIEILRRGFPTYFPVGIPGAPPGGGPPGPPRAPGEIPGNRVGFFTEEQIALFGELAFDFTDTFNAAVSFRALDLEHTAYNVNTGFFNANIQNTDKTNDNQEFLPKVTLTWTPQDDRLFYVSASEGFRTGIINLTVTPGDASTDPDGPTGPLEPRCAQELRGVGMPNGIEDTNPDSVNNYEIGGKMGFGEGRSTLNWAVYRIDWQALQQQVFLAAFYVPPPGVTQQTSMCQIDVIMNVGDATNEGFEVEFTTALTERLRLDTAFAYVDAKHTTDFPQLSIYSGQTIQLTPQQQVFLGLQYSFQIGSLPASIRGDWTYTGEMVPRASDFARSPPLALGEYDVVNLRGSIDFTDRMTFDVWLDNAADEWGVTRAFDLSGGGAGQGTYHTIRPRTAGATLRWQF